MYLFYQLTVLNRIDSDIDGLHFNVFTGSKKIFKDQGDFDALNVYRR